MAFACTLACLLMAAGGKPAEASKEKAATAPPADSPRETPPVTGKRKIVAPSSASSITAPPTEEEKETLEEERKQDLEIFIRRTRDFTDVVDGMVRRSYKLRLKHLKESYETMIQDEEKLEIKSLDDAIEYFKEFLKKYPDDPPYTPDAMYRLGELYYDKAYLKYQKQLERYSQALDKGQTDDMTPPEKDFTDTIALFRELIERYPDYRSIDGAFYVLGYCLKESGEEEEGRLAWLNGVCANKYRYDPDAFAAEKAAEASAKKQKRPALSLDTGVKAAATDVFVDPFEGCEPINANSRFLFESWWLIGEYHFDFDTSRFGVETAISAYKKLAENPEHKFYDKGLYKLAWSYFKADRYPESIQAFSKVVDFADSQEEQQGGTMRPEAVQYLAVCFFEEDWNMDMVPDEVSGIERLQDPSLMPQDRKWTQEVYERLGDIYSDNEKNPEAIELWRMFIAKWPLDVRAPFVQQKIAREFAKMQEAEQEIAERSALDKYGPGSEWWAANADHPAEQNEVAEMTRDALLEAAYHFHQTAQGLRQRGLAAQDAVLLERAIEKYNLAANAYRKFIEQNPDTPDAYDISFNLAETLYWSGQYELAKERYKIVRDSNLDDKYRTDAAYMVIVSLEEIFKKQAAAGILSMREAPPEVSGEPPTAPKLEIPPVALELMNEREAFLRDAPNHEDASKFQYQTAQNYYRYGHWDEAKVRYEQIYDQYCYKDPIAFVSWQTMMNMASDLNDVDERERLALLQQKKSCSVKGIEKLTGQTEAEIIDVDTILGDVAMRRALDMLKTCMDGKKSKVCSEAGDSLVAAVSKAPDHPDADKALHNAALAYEIGQRFESAMKLYGRIVEEYPKSKYVGKCLFQQASAANNFFEYDKALENYRILADEARFRDYENRTVSVYNSAYILTNLQRYEEAIPYWKRYAAEEQDPSKSAEADFNAADMYFKAKAWRRAINAYDSFIAANERSKEAQPMLVKASYRISQAERKLGRKKNQIRAWQRTVDLYNRAPEPGSMTAEYAAESHFKLIEIDMRKFEKYTIKGTMKIIQDKINTAAEKVKSFENRYREISKYGRPEWSLAAEFRIGYAYEAFAKSMLNIPFPPLAPDDERMLRQLPREDRELVLVELEDRFRQEMEKKVAPAEEKAQTEYKIAVDLARKGNISNAWTLLALERMNAYDPENYPRQHNGVILIERNTLTAPPLEGEVQR
jgi:tetratricopeptide (TPR) repeat protein